MPRSSAKSQACCQHLNASDGREHGFAGSDTWSNAGLHSARASETKREEVACHSQGVHKRLEAHWPKCITTKETVNHSTPKKKLESTHEYTMHYASTISAVLEAKKLKAPQFML
jgi:hypothetical protein